MKSGQYHFIPQDRIIYGRPALEVLNEVIEELGVKRLFIVSSHTLSRNTELIASIKKSLGEKFVGLFDDSVAHTPREAVFAAARAVSKAAPDLIVTVGGGSVIDTVKMLQIVLAEELSSTDELSNYYMQLLDDGSVHIPAVKPSPVRQVIISTTLAGAEFSNWCGCTDLERQVKDIYTSRDICAHTVILDPAVTVHTPDWLWLSTGIRAIDHAIESMSEPTCPDFIVATNLYGLTLLSHSLRANKAKPADLEMRLQSQIGVWLASTGIGRMPWGASHGIGHQLGCVAHVPHGYTSCILLPQVMRWNREYTGDAFPKIAKALGDETADAPDMVAKLISDLGLPTRLAHVDFDNKYLDAVIKGSMSNLCVLSNPRPINDESQVADLLQQVM